MHCDVLGSAGSQPSRGRACSGYLVSTATTTVLVDCGFGVAQALTAHMEPGDLDAIVITHRHLDHAIDLLGLWAVMRRGNASVPVHVAPGVDETLSAMVTPARMAQWRARLPMHPIVAGDTVVVGDLTIDAHHSDHDVPTVSLRITDVHGAVLAYSSDSAGGGDLEACARDADLFLVEASWQVDGEQRGGGHMTALRAAEVAVAVNASRLVLTHLRPHLDPAVSIAEAAQAWSGEVIVAQEGMRLTVGDPGA